MERSECHGGSGVHIVGSAAHLLIAAAHSFSRMAGYMGCYLYSDINQNLPLPEPGLLTRQFHPTPIRSACPRQGFRPHRLKKAAPEQGGFFGYLVNKKSVTCTEQYMYSGKISTLDTPRSVGWYRWYPAPVFWHSGYEERI